MRYCHRFSRIIALFFLLFCPYQLLHAQGKLQSKHAIGLSFGLDYIAAKDRVVSPVTYTGLGSYFQIAYFFNKKKTKQALRLNFTNTKPKRVVINRLFQNRSNQNHFSADYHFFYLVKGKPGQELQFYLGGGGRASLLRWAQFYHRSDQPAQEENFETLWQEFDKLYPYFAHKGIDWDRVYADFRPRADTVRNDAGLHDLFVDMLEPLKDGHVALFTQFGKYTYSGWFLKRPDDFNLTIIRLSYLANRYSVYGEGQITFRPALIGNSLFETLPIGYLHIANFLKNDIWLRDIDAIFDDFSAGALIIDVRNNSGGNDLAMMHLAGRMADRKRVFGSVQFRNGPGHNDFTESTPRYIEPRGSSQFTGPIAVLTNIGTFSAAESFVLAMKSLPHVTVIGDTTGGGSGNPINRELPNGWTYMLSTWIERDADGNIYEGIGIAPDVYIPPALSNPRLFTDITLNHAIQLLKEKISR